MNRSEFVCADCHGDLDPQGDCARCGLAHQWTPNGIGYNADRLLYRDFPRKYRVHKVLQNNGEVAYRVLAESSLSLEGRRDVAAFRDFLAAHISSGRVLDVGCGALPLPAYLDLPGELAVYGVDPLPAPEFRGVGVTGAAEFLPFPDGHFDALIFAGSLDHVCSLEKTAAETRRVLRPGGKVLVWMGDRSETLVQKIAAKLRTVARNVVRGYRTDKFIVYDNLAVFYVPKGAVDQFHTFKETPRMIERLFGGAGFEHVETRPVDFGAGPSAFLAFRRPDAAPGRS